LEIRFRFLKPNALKSFNFVVEQLTTRVRLRSLAAPPAGGRHATRRRQIRTRSFKFVVRSPYSPGDFELRELETTAFGRTAFLLSNHDRRPAEGAFRETHSTFVGPFGPVLHSNGVRRPSPEPLAEGAAEHGLFATTNRVSQQLFNALVLNRGTGGSELAGIPAERSRSCQFGRPATSHRLIG
jgi:hypothetical protein